MSKLTIDSSIKKIQTEKLPFWKLYHADKYTGKKLDVYSSWGEDDVEKSVSHLISVINDATEVEDANFHIEAGATRSANQDGLKKWQIIALTNNTTPNKRGNPSPSLGGLGTLEHPFVQNMLSGLDRREQSIKEEEKLLNRKEYELAIDRMKLEFERDAFNKDKQAHDKKEAELREWHKNEIEKLTDRMKVGEQTAKFIFGNILENMGKKPEVVSNVLGALFNEDVQMAISNTDDAPSSPEELVIQEMATYIADANLPIGAIEAISNKVKADVDTIKSNL